MRKPEGILFDLGGTLLRESNFDRMAGRARLLDIAHNPNGITLADYSKAADTFLAAAYGSRETNHREYSVAAFVAVMSGRLGLEFDIPHEEVEIEFWKATSALAPEPGVRDALDALCERHLPLGVVSNSVFSGRTLSWELERHGLRDAFAFVLSSADHGLRKPHPSIFNVAAERLGRTPGEIWFIGDSLPLDIAGARAAGMSAVWYNPNGTPCDGPQPEAIIAHWHELQALLTDAE